MEFDGHGAHIGTGIDAVHNPGGADAGARAHFQDAAAGRKRSAERGEPAG